jgi:hypothetical protein
MEAQFIRREWEDTGEDGWALQGASEAYNPTSGFGLSHDFFEHGLKLDTIQDEIMAHGAMYWLRWETGYVYRNGADVKPERIGWEFENLLRGMYDATLDPAPKTQRLDDDTEELLTAIVAEGRKAAEGIADEDDADSIDQLVAHYAGWFRKGYRWARSYYKAGAERTVYDGFHALTEAVDELEKRELYHGDELHISFSPVSCKLTVRLVRQCGECFGGRVDVDSGEYLCEDCLEANAEVY